jgi:hypothetical protein
MLISSSGVRYYENSEHSYSFNEIVKILKSNKQIPKELLKALHNNINDLPILKTFIKDELTVGELTNALKNNPELLDWFL